jgi:predicted dehydrogenase
VQSGSPAHSPIRLGIVGTGLAAQKLHWPALARMRERFQIVAFSDRRRSTAEEYAALASLSMDSYVEDYHDLLRRDDVEAVLVAVPIPFLRAVSSDCLQAGKHVMSEKPPGTSEAEAREFVSLVARYPGQKTLMAEQFFYRDESRLARSLLDDGAIGQVRVLGERMARLEVPLPGTFASTPWRSKPAYPGGSLLDGGIHNVATIRLLGGNVTRVFARTEWLNDTIHDAPSVLSMTAEFANGGTCDYFYGSFALPVADEANGTRLYGTEGNIVISWGKLKLIRRDGSIVEYQFDRHNGYFNELVNFHEAIAYDEPIVGTVAQSLSNMLIVLRALESAETGQPVGVAESRSSEAGVPLWRPRGATGLYDGLPIIVSQTRA